MKFVFVLALSLISSAAFPSQSGKMTCASSTSELTLEKSASSSRLTGTHNYNKNQNGQYQSSAQLECQVVPLNNWDFVDCTETIYGIYYSMYQLPKNAFAQKVGSVFSIVEMLRDENSSEIGNTRRIDNCILQ